METKNCTSIKQSQKFIELGIDRKTSDMYYWCGEDLRIGGYKAQDDEYDISAWSLSALIEILPDKIIIDGKCYFLSLKKTSISYLGHITWDGQLHKSFENDNLIDAAFEAICWLKENNKI